MLQVKWSDEASLDLVEVIDYVEQRDPFASARLHEEAMHLTFTAGAEFRTREKL